MKGFALAKLVRSTRQVLALFIAAVFFVGAASLGTYRLSNPGHYPACLGATVEPMPLREWHPCKPPTRAGWQIPVCVLIALCGVSVAVVVTSRRPSRFAGQPEEHRVLRV